VIDELHVFGFAYAHLILTIHFHQVEVLGQQFKNAMYRLRRALSKNIIQFDQASDRYAFNWETDYQYDLELFREMFKRAQQAKNKDDKLSWFTKAIDIYRGDYLIEAEGVWAIPIRESLRRSYTDSVLAVIELQIDRQEYDQALQYCLDLISKDPCQEVAHRFAMQVFAAQSNRAEVARQYNQCSRSLAEHLGATPSVETESLYKQLMN
jgi:LuxR family transcriptional regulator, maltose regulon positive regulatory protein